MTDDEIRWECQSCGSLIERPFYAKKRGTCPICEKEAVFVPYREDARDREDYYPDPQETFEEPDDRITYVQNIEFAYDEAEDVKVVRFESGEKALEVGITDDIMVEFIETAEAVFDKIHLDMSEMHDLMRDSSDGGEGDA